MFRHTTGLVVSSQHVHFLRVSQFHAAKEQKYFYWAEATVDVVSQEKEFALREAPVYDFLKHMEHVEELSVDISNYNTRRVYD